MIIIEREVELSILLNYHMESGLKKLMIMIGIILMSAIIFTLSRHFKSKDKYQAQIDKIETALKSWSEEYHDLLPAKGTITIPIATLKQSGYLDDLNNPKTHQHFSNQLLTTITKEKKQYVYKVLDKDSNMVEDYNEVNKKAPMIWLNGKSLEYIELGYPYRENGVVALTTDRKEADEMKTTIKENEKSVSSVDTSKVGTYQITYQASYAKESSSISRIIVVRDTEAPKVKKLERLIITPEQVKELDLLEDVKVEDNSGEKVKTKIIGSLSNIPGKYILTYEFSDSSGNKIEKKRVVRVEENKDSDIPEAEHEEKEQKE